MYSSGFSPFKDQLLQSLVNRLSQIPTRKTSKESKHGLYNHIKVKEIQPCLWSSQGSPLVAICEGIAYKISMLLFKCKFKVAPKYLQELLPNRQHTRSLRSFISEYMDPRFCKNTLVKKSSVSSVGPRTWNSLPDSFNAQDNVNLFKKELKTHLFKLSYDNWSQTCTTSTAKN